MCSQRPKTTKKTNNCRPQNEIRTIRKSGSETKILIITKNMTQKLSKNETKIVSKLNDN